MARRRRDLKAAGIRRGAEALPAGMTGIKAQTTKDTKFTKKDPHQKIIPGSRLRSLRALRGKLFLDGST